MLKKAAPPSGAGIAILSEFRMCDYSLAELSSRLAVEGERLLLHRFSTGSMGLRAERRRWREVLFPSCATAVCIPPGARLVLEGISPSLQHQLGVSTAEPVTFVQRSLEVRTYRDGIRFANGQEILLQQLAPGQRVIVLRLDSEDSPADSPDEARVITEETHAFPI